jgi:hypothetical protein
MENVINIEEEGITQVCLMQDYYLKYLRNTSNLTIKEAKMGKRSKQIFPHKIYRWQLSIRNDIQSNTSLGIVNLKKNYILIRIVKKIPNTDNIKCWVGRKRTVAISVTADQNAK